MHHFIWIVLQVLNKSLSTNWGWCNANYNEGKDTTLSTKGYVFIISGGAISLKSKKQKQNLQQLPMQPKKVYGFKDYFLHW